VSSVSDRRLDFAIRRMDAKLDGREPVFLEVPELEKGKMAFDERELPVIFVASDVYRTLERGLAAFRATGQRAGFRLARKG
jgi:hypothetical protein